MARKPKYVIKNGNGTWGPVPSNLKEFTLQFQNSCAATGKLHKAGDTVFAENEDAARAGVFFSKAVAAWRAGSDKKIEAAESDPNAKEEEEEAGE